MMNSTSLAVSQFGRSLLDFVSDDAQYLFFCSQLPKFMKMKKNLKHIYVQIFMLRMTRISELSFQLYFGISIYEDMAQKLVVMIVFNQVDNFITVRKAPLYKLDTKRGQETFIKVFFFTKKPVLDLVDSTKRNYTQGYMIVFNKVDDFVTVFKSSLIQAGDK